MATEFTPIGSLLGGAFIGLAAVWLMWSLGRVMGATGILAGIVAPTAVADFAWRAAVLAGMVAGPFVFGVVFGGPPAFEVPVSTWMLCLGGLLVGVGVTLGSGCTSGHGVCGLARFSRRSIAAVLMFMATAFVTVFVLRHIVGG